MAGTESDIDQAQTGPNVKVYHEYPFDPVEAAGKEEAALAHIEALRQLTEASGGPVVHPMNTGTKGPRETYETTTSVPSFGHILHQDGMPVSRHMSYQQEPFMSSHGPILLGQGAVARELAGLSGTGFFHVPYGPDVRLRFGAGVPGGPLGGWKSMLGSPADITVNPVTQAGVPGTTGGEPLGVIAESPATEQPQRRDDKSAYVESITDVSHPLLVLCGLSCRLYPQSLTARSKNLLFGPAGLGGLRRYTRTSSPSKSTWFPPDPSPESTLTPLPKRPSCRTHIMM